VKSRAPMKIVIDKKSGFCFGVINAIGKAEEVLARVGHLYCLGDIVHNEAEVAHLQSLGMETITRDTYFRLSNCEVLIRAHGEPPETYEYAAKHNITLIDATCPVVLQLQKRVKTAWKNLMTENGQLVFFGKPGHAETVGINGQIGNNAIIVQKTEDLEKIDFSKPVEVFSQTTMPLKQFNDLTGQILERAADKDKVTIRDTICRQVTNRGPHLKIFASQFDVVIFVAGKKSSNGIVLYQVCKSVNPRTYPVEGAAELRAEWFSDVDSVGICGATSTPFWLMEKVADSISRDFSKP